MCTGQNDGDNVNYDVIEVDPAGVALHVSKVIGDEARIFLPGHERY